MIVKPSLLLPLPLLVVTIISSITHPSYSLSTTTKITEPKRRNNTPRRTPRTPWVVTASATELTRAASRYLQPGDVVLELGAQLAGTSARICEVITSSGEATLVDVKRKHATSGRSPNRNVNKYYRSGKEMDDPTYNDRATFVELDHFDEWRQVLYGGGGGAAPKFDVLIVDVSHMIGNDLPLTAIALVQEFMAHQQKRCTQLLDDDDNTSTSYNGPRAVLLKSTALSSLGRRLIHAAHLADGTFTLPPPSSSPSSREPYIIASVGVDEYRKTIPNIVQKGDSVLEVGCYFGTSTVLLHEAAAATTGTEGGDAASKGFCIGVDIGKKIIDSAKSAYPAVPFAVADAWKTADLLRLREELVPSSSEHGGRGYDVVYADIGGLSGPDGTLEVLALLDALGRALEPRCIVVKSKCMRNLASCLKPFSRVWQTLSTEEREACGWQKDGGGT